MLCRSLKLTFIACLTPFCVPVKNELGRRVAGGEWTGEESKVKIAN
jgi:hypothetical protein